MRDVPKNWQECKHTETESVIPYGTDVKQILCKHCGKEMDRIYV